MNFVIDYTRKNVIFISKKGLFNSDHISVKQSVIYIYKASSLNEFTQTILR